ncbi:MAG: sensor histidine kinase [Notoacmeibacter sp.]|nr:sensor histidine kinase [Notoacmeibacter sp.]
MQVIYDQVAIYLSMTFLVPGAVFAVLGRTIPGKPALDIWALAFLSLFASTVLTAIRGSDPSALMLILPNLLVGLGYVGGIAGLRSIKGLRVVTPAMTALLAVYLLLLTFTVASGGSWSTRVAVISSGIAGFSFLLACAALRRFGGASRMSDLIIVTAMAINALIAGLRAAVAVAPALVPALPGPLVESLFFFWSIAAAVSLGIAFYLQFHAVADTETRQRVREMARLQESLERSLSEQAGMKQILIHELRRPINLIASTLDVMDTGEERRMGAAQILRLKRLTHGAGAVLDEIADLVELSDLIDYPDRRRLPIGTLAEDIGLKWSVPVSCTAGLAGRMASIDPLLFDAAVGNLIANAQHHGTACCVGFSSENGHLLVDVTDDGPGIPAEQWSRVWEKFTQVGDVSSSPSGRVGVGLYLARGIARAHGGEAMVVSRVPSVIRLTFSLEAAGRHG